MKDQNGYDGGDMRTINRIAIRWFLYLVLSVTGFLSLGNITLAEGSSVPFIAYSPTTSYLERILSEQLSKNISSYQYQIIETVQGSDLYEGIDVSGGDILGVVVEPRFLEYKEVSLGEEYMFMLRDITILEGISPGTYRISGLSSGEMSNVTFYWLEKRYDYIGSKVVSYSEEVDFDQIVTQRDIWIFSRYRDNPSEREEEPLLGVSIDDQRSDAVLYVVSNPLLANYGIVFERCQMDVEEGKTNSSIVLTYRDEVECISFENATLPHDDIVKVKGSVLASLVYLDSIPGAEIQRAVVLSKDLLSIEEKQFEGIMEEIQLVLDQREDRVIIDDSAVFRDLLWSVLTLVFVLLGILILWGIRAILLRDSEFLERIRSGLRKTILFSAIIMCIFCAISFAILFFFSRKAGGSINHYIESMWPSSTGSLLCLECVLFKYGELVKVIFLFVLIVVLYTLRDIVLGGAVILSKKLRDVTSVRLVDILFLVVLCVSGIMLVQESLSYVWVAITFVSGVFALAGRRDELGGEVMRGGAFQRGLMLLLFLVISLTILSDIGSTLVSIWDGSYEHSVRLVPFGMIMGRSRVEDFNVPVEPYVGEDKYLSPAYDEYVLGSSVVALWESKLTRDDPYIKYRGIVSTDSLLYLTNRDGANHLCYLPGITDMGLDHIADFGEFSIYGKENFEALVSAESIAQIFSSNSTVGIDPEIVTADPLSERDDRLFLGEVLDPDEQLFAGWNSVERRVFDKPFYLTEQSILVYAEDGLDYQMDILGLNEHIGIDTMRISVSDLEGNIVSNDTLNLSRPDREKNSSVENYTIDLPGLSGWYLIYLRSNTEKRDLVVVSISSRSPVIGLYTYPELYIGNSLNPYDFSVAEEYTTRRESWQGVLSAFEDSLEDEVQLISDDTGMSTVVSVRETEKRFDLLILPSEYIFVNDSDKSGGVFFECGYTVEDLIFGEIVKDEFFSVDGGRIRLRSTKVTVNSGEDK